MTDCHSRLRVRGRTASGRANGRAIIIPLVGRIFHWGLAEGETEREVVLFCMVTNNGSQYFPSTKVGM